MLVRTLKLKLNRDEESRLDQWLWHLTAVWNFAIRKIELDARDGVYHSEFDFKGLLAGHSKTLGIPSHVMRGILDQAYSAWKRCFAKLSKRPRLKGKRNPLNSIPFPDPLKRPSANKVRLPGLTGRPGCQNQGCCRCYGMNFPDQPPAHIEALIQRGWQHYITDHPTYREREVPPDRLRQDHEVFVAAFIFGYLARQQEEKHAP